MKKNNKKMSEDLTLTFTISESSSEMVMKLEKIIEKEMVNKKFTKNVPFKN